MDILAANFELLTRTATQLGSIFYFTVLPVLLVAAIGFVIQRKCQLDMQTLTRLNFYFTVPALVYFSLVTSKVQLSDVATVIMFSGAFQLLLVATVLITAAVRRVSKDHRRALLMSVMFYNSGNFGLPLQELAFRPIGQSAFAASIQVFVMLFQNILSFTLGIFIVAGGKSSGGSFTKLLKHVITFPPVHALAAAIVTIQLRSCLGDSTSSVAQALQPFWQALEYIKNGFFAVALVTLGAQLANVARGSGGYPVRLSVVLRLLISPLLGLAAIYLLGIGGLTAQVLLISTTSPTAVNAMLLCLQFDNHPQFLAKSVLYSTLMAPLTVTFVILIAQGNIFSQLQYDPSQSETIETSQNIQSKETTMTEKTRGVDIQGDKFFINGEVTYKNRVWNDMNIEGLLLNSRMVQASFDDLNSETRHLWAHDGEAFDAEANTDNFIAQLPVYSQHGLNGITINLQGGSPQGYSKDQPWINSAFNADGSIREDYIARIDRIIAAADDCGIAVMLGLFYFGQDQVLTDEAAVIKAVENTVDWLIAKDHRNVLIELANEANHPKYDHKIIHPDRCIELMELIADRSGGKIDTAAGRLLVSVSLTGGKIPSDAVIAASDFILLHGNGVKDPAKISEMVDTCRQSESYRGQPIVFNEDDHFDFDKPVNNMLAAVKSYASWGYFDYRMAGEDYEQGFQSVPVDWSISSDRKQGFFNLLKRITSE